MKRRSKVGRGDSFDQCMGRAGIVYILRNDAFQTNWYKIGCTQRSAEARAAEINRDAGTGIPGIFKPAFSIKTLDCGKAEREVHSLLARYRRGKKGQEHFEVDFEFAKKTISNVCANVDASTAARHAEAQARANAAALAEAKARIDAIAKAKAQVSSEANEKWTTGAQGAPVSEKTADQALSRSVPETKRLPPVPFLRPRAVPTANSNGPSATAVVTTIVGVCFLLWLIGGIRSQSTPRSPAVKIAMAEVPTATAIAPYKVASPSLEKATAKKVFQIKN